jgi:hypothetical protein
VADTEDATFVVHRLLFMVIHMIDLVLLVARHPLTIILDLAQGHHPVLLHSVVVTVTVVGDA